MNGFVSPSEEVRPIETVLASPHLPMLDGLRAVAVMIVIVGHGWHAIPADLGVSIFFVLSGFLITWLLLLEQDRSSRVSLTQFYIRRALRIFPAYYAFLAITIAADWVLGDMRFKEFGGWAATYVMNYYNALHNHPSTSVAHAWSLAIEEQFYLVWPALFIGLSRWGRTGLCLGLSMLIGGVVAWRCLAWFVLDFPTAWIYNAFDTRFDNLAVGCLLAVLLTSPKVRSGLPLLSRRWWLPIGSIALLVVSRSVLPTNPWHYGLGFTVDAALIAIAIVQLLQLSHHRAWRWLDLPWIRYLGAISYPMYLYHAWGAAAGGRASALPGPLQFFLGLVLTVVLAAASYRFIEKPFLTLKGRLSATPTSPTPIAVGPDVAR